MTIQEAIEKAREGGWEPNHWDENGETFYLQTSHGHEQIKLNIYRLLLSPLFLKFLGKAMGWGVVKPCRCKNHCLDCSEFVYFWHRLIDHLAEGGTVESFFEKL
jgi:hypothetical protein